MEDRSNRIKSTVAHIVVISLAVAVMMGIGVYGSMRKSDKGTEQNTSVTEGTEIVVEATTEAAAAVEEVEKHDLDEYKSTDYVQLGDYKGIKVEVKVDKLAPDFEESAIRSLQQQYVSYADLDDKVIGNESIVKMDITDGDGNVTKDFYYKMGVSGEFEAYESDWISQKVPFEDSNDEYKFKIKAVAKEVLPEIDDNWIKEYTDFDSLEAYLKDKTDKENERLQKDRTNDFRANLMDELRKRCTFKEMPEELIAYEMYQYRLSDAKSADNYKKSLEEFVVDCYGYDDMAEYEEELREFVISSLQSSFVLKAIGEKEHIEVSDEEYKKFVAESIEEYSFDDEAALIEAFGEDTVHKAVYHDKVWAFLEQNNELVETEQE